MDNQIIRLNWRCNCLVQQCRTRKFRTLSVPKAASFRTSYSTGGMVLYSLSVLSDSLCVNLVNSYFMRLRANAVEVRIYCILLNNKLKMAFEDAGLSNSIYYLNFGSWDEDTMVVMLILSRL